MARKPKLSEAQQQEIKNNPDSLRELAVKYGVSYVTISRIKNATKKEQPVNECTDKL